MFSIRFGVDLDELPNFIAEIEDIRTKAPTVFPLQGVLMRFSDKDEAYMANSYGRQTVHFEFYLWNRKDPYNQPSGSLAGYQTILQMLVSYLKCWVILYNNLMIFFKLWNFREKNTTLDRIGEKVASYIMTATV